MYVEDSWRVTHNVTVNAGLRYGLQPPVYEANNQQASTNIPLGDWLNSRAALAGAGLSQSNAGLITFIPSNGDGGRPLYPFFKNWAPRVSIAYSPDAGNGLAKFFFGGPGKSSIRAGAGMYYDIVGQPLAQTFNSTAFGLASQLTSPPNVLTAANAPRMTDYFTLPAAVVPPAPAGGLPRTYPTSGAGSFAITNSIDDALKAPYTMNLDFSLSRELPHAFLVQASYVGRLSRRSLVQRDLAMPTNLVDPKSGQSYFQAMSQLAQYIDFQHIASLGSNGVANVANIPRIPFFENMWANAAAGGFSPTQIWAKDYLENSAQGDFTNTLNNADGTNCSTSGTSFTSRGAVSSVGCGVQGPFMMFNPQFSALAAWSSVGSGAYHAMQWTVRKRYSSGLQFDVNYTFSKSIDFSSRTETSARFQGFLQNTWNTRQERAVSNYDTTHFINAISVWELPIGRGKKFGSNMNGVLNAIIGGWQITGTYRQSSGLPFNVDNGLRWPTNWEVDAFGTPNGKPIPPVVSAKNAPAIVGAGGPNLWNDPAAAFAAFSETLPGQSGTRNTLRGDGIFDIDAGVGKTFVMPYSEHHRLQIRAEAFNLTNSVRFEPYFHSRQLD